jgi:hypothetical protein
MSSYVEEQIKAKLLELDPNTEFVDDALKYNGFTTYALGFRYTENMPVEDIKKYRKMLTTAAWQMPVYWNLVDYGNIDGLIKFMEDKRAGKNVPEPPKHKKLYGKLVVRDIAHDIEEDNETISVRWLFFDENNNVIDLDKLQEEAENRCN